MGNSCMLLGRIETVTRDLSFYKEENKKVEIHSSVTSRDLVIILYTKRLKQ